MHPNAMTGWESIGCTRGHGHHETIWKHVDLHAEHGYGDLPKVPAEFGRRFTMELHDWRRYLDGEGYCPGHDAVSETIDLLGIWEPAETISTLAACIGHPGELMVDFGMHLGWFSLLAASCGLEVRGFEADSVNAETAHDSFAANRWPAPTITVDRITVDTPAMEPTVIRLAKIDVEGAENQAVRMLGPSIDAGLVDHMLIEISPCFDDYYPDLVVDLVVRGFRSYQLPPKRRPPHAFSAFPDDLDAGRLDLMSESRLRDLVGSWTQEDVWFTREGASWG